VALGDLSDHESVIGQGRPRESESVMTGTEPTYPTRAADRAARDEPSGWAGWVVSPAS
jgi:hypothetical protein